MVMAVLPRTCLSEEIKLLNFSENIKSQPQVAEVEKKCEMCERYEIMQSLLIC